jgi:TonB family protein
MTQHLPRPDLASGGIPQAYAEIAARALVKDASKRWTVREIAKSIGFELPEPGTSKPPKPETQVPDKPEPGSDARHGASRRVPGLVFFLLVVAILALTLTVKLLNQHRASPGAKNSPSTSRSEPATISSLPAEPPIESGPAPGAAVQAGAVLHQMLPNVSPGALRTIQGHVKVRLHLKVDAKGSVSEARFVSAGPSQYFARHAIEAAHQWTFTPPQLNGQSRSSEWNLLFEFSRGGVKAFPEQVHTR